MGNDLHICSYLHAFRYVFGQVFLIRRFSLFGLATVLLLSPNAEAQEALVNGENHLGIIDPNEEDVWTFVAESGETVVLRVGKTGGDINFRPQLSLFDPENTLIETRQDSNTDTRLEYVAETGGTYSVSVSSSVLGNDGPYTLRYLKLPGEIITPDAMKGGH